MSSNGSNNNNYYREFNNKIYYLIIKYPIVEIFDVVKATYFNLIK
jgi:hypothetical protein